MACPSFAVFRSAHITAMAEAVFGEADKAKRWLPSTTNYLFNPRHPQAQSATIQVEDFTPDSRLF